jgi:GT2 family glycosyltransferase
MKLGIVVLNWNGKDVTPRCLDSIYRSSSPPDAVVVVDNASADGSRQLIRDRYPGAILIENASNLGFAGGCNVGIRYLLEHDFDLVLLLNNDAEIDRNCLHELKSAAESYPAAAYGATIHEHANPGVLWYAGGVLDPATLVARHETTPGSTQPRPTDFITGCCLLMRAEALRRLGPLDESYFAYYEDLDWCLRSRAAGDRLIYVPRAVLNHEVSHSFRRAGAGSIKASPFAWAQSRPLVMYLSYRNRLLLARKHAAGTTHRMFLFARMSLRGLVHAALLFTIGEWARARAVLHGLTAGLFRPSAPVEIRRYI